MKTPLSTIVAFTIVGAMILAIVAIVASTSEHPSYPLALAGEVAITGLVLASLLAFLAALAALRVVVIYWWRLKREDAAKKTGC